MTIKKINVNPDEKKTDGIICDIMEKNGYRVCPKMRVADVFQVDKRNLEPKKFYYSLGAHFDFTIVNNEDDPQFSVEFDGLYHEVNKEAMQKDQFKNEICKMNNYPLIRITETFFRQVGKFTILSWLLEVWCLSKAFYEAQDSGQIPENESFDYWTFIELNQDLKLEFSHNPFFQYQAYFHKLYEEKKILSRPQPINYKTPDGFTNSWVVLPIDNEKALVQRFRIQSYACFPVCDFELCEEISLLLLFEKYRRYQKTGCGTINTDKAFSESNKLIKKYKNEITVSV